MAKRDDYFDSLAKKKTLVDNAQSYCQVFNKLSQKTKNPGCLVMDFLESQDEGLSLETCLNFKVNDETLLSSAIKGQNNEEIKYLFSFDELDLNWGHHLQIADVHNNILAMKLLLLKGANVNILSSISKNAPSLLKIVELIDQLKLDVKQDKPVKDYSKFHCINMSEEIYKKILPAIFKSELLKNKMEALPFEKFELLLSANVYNCLNKMVVEHKTAIDSMLRFGTHLQILEYDNKNVVPKALTDCDFSKKGKDAQKSERTIEIEALNKGIILIKNLASGKIDVINDAQKALILGLFKDKEVIKKYIPGIYKRLEKIKDTLADSITEELPDSDLYSTHDHESILLGATDSSGSHQDNTDA